MSSNLVIVALPEDSDPVRKVSSEKEPHLTLLFLGDVDSNPNIDRIFAFVGHAVNIAQHGEFYLDVDYRGILGPDKADVIHFRKSWNYAWVNQFRNQLLQNTDIKSAYESVEQFPEWRPHLTLGYPETPAHEDKMPEFGLNAVRFDRIAVWTGNYEGPWFRLEWPEGEYADVAMSGAKEAGLTAVEKLLEHHGVKGMKWGERKPRSIVKQPKNALTGKQMAVAIGTGGLAIVNKGIRDAAKENERRNINFQADKKWEKDFRKAKGFTFDDRKFTDKYNAKWKDHDFSKEDWNNPSPKYHEYIGGYVSSLSKEYTKQFADHYGESPSGLYEAHHEPGTDLIKLRQKDTAQHADLVLATFRINREEDGLISGLDKVETELAQAAVEDILEHHGVKGMKWGVSKDRHGRDRFSPEGHTLGADYVKSLLLPPGANVPALVRLGKRANQATKAYLEKRNQPEAVAKRAARKLARRDFYWDNHAYSDMSHADVHNKVADEIDTKVFQLQTAPKYRGKSLKTDKALKNEYEQDVAKVTDAAYRRAVKDTFGTNPSGTKKAHYVDDVRGPRIEIRDTSSGKTLHERELNPVQKDLTDEDTLGHAATEAYSGPDIMITVKTDTDGFITEMGRVKLPEDDVAHSIDEGEVFVEAMVHYGVKGMHWGQRRSPPSAVVPSATSRVPHGDKRKTKITAEGGQNHPAHEDAIKVAEARAKLVKSGTASLSNKELKDVANRIRLEKEVVELNRSRTSGFVRSFLSGQGKQGLNTAVGSRVQRKVRVS